MFKSLRDKLAKVSSQLEDELEAQLESELEAELAASLEKDDGPKAEAAPAGPPTQEGTDVQAEKRPDEEPASGADPTVEKDTATPAAAPPATSEEATPRKAEGEGTPTEAPEEEDTPLDTSPAPKVDREPAGDGSQSEPRDTDAPPPGPPREREQQEDPAVAAKTDAPVQAERRAKTGRPAKPKRPVTGRKILSDEEISERLSRELDAAVESQREVERTVTESSGGRVARYTINEDILEDILWELEVALLESDVALPVVEAIKENVKEQLLSMTVGGRDPHDVVEKVLRTAIKRVLSVSPIDFDAFLEQKLAEGKRPVVVMFVGVNGTGKTTSIARLAYRLQQQGRSCVLAAGDTFRAGAIEQLTQHANKLGVKIIKHSAGADPAAVAYDAIDHAKARNKDVVLLDTAGRMQTNTNLMDEMDKIRRVADPDLVVFVGDSLAGNDAVEQARRFDEVVDIDGAILTKVDVDAKGGAALSVAYTINKPLLFVGVGQDYPDLRPFDAGWLVDRLFGDEGQEETVAAQA